MHFVHGDEAALRIIVKQQRAEIEQLKHAVLSGEEREAIERAADFCESTSAPLPRSDQMLAIRDLLSRLA